MAGNPAVDPFERLNAALTDRYTIERVVGSGGMATVYLAHDLKHDRKVAIKVLRAELAAVLGADRFVQEIKTTANLQHPHILPLFDSGRAVVPRRPDDEQGSMGDVFLYYVMPFVDGETLRDKLNRETQVSIDEAVRITADIADALDYAHRQNVIHRDIKPENILLRDGRPLVADFGIALAVSAAAGGRMTETGLSLGTPHYMSPEQATAEREVSSRSDIYSLGCVLYEMLTGAPPHSGASAHATIMMIVTDEVRSVTDLRKTVPLNVASAVHVALHKLPADRFSTASEFAAALQNPTFTSTVVPMVRRPALETKQWQRATAAVAGVALLMTGLFVWSLMRAATAPSNPVTRFAFAMARPGDEPWITISPDGRRVLMVHTGDDGTTRVVARDLAAPEVVPIAGTEGADGPFFSPDGQWIGFRTDRGLRKIPASGGAAVEITDGCDAPASWHGSSIICVSTATWGLSRVSADGGTPETLTVPDTTAGEIGHWRPEVLPGGHAVIFTNFRAPATNRIEAFDLQTQERTVLIEGAVFARYSRSGHLLFVRDEALFVVPFDAERVEVLGGPMPVAEDVAQAPSLALGGFAVSPTGTLVVIKASEWKPRTQLVWVGRDGTEDVAIATPGDYMHPRLSPNGRLVVLTVQNERRDLQLYDVNRGALSQIRNCPGQALRAVWTPDGRELLYTVESPAYDLYRMPIDGSSPERPLVSNSRDKFAMSVSPDGEVLAYEERAVSGPSRIVFVGLDGSGRTLSFGDTLIDTSQPAISPDGRWIAYSGVVSGATEVYLRAMDGSGGRRQVSAGGGELPRWTRGGREIVYRRGDVFFAVPVNGSTGEIGTPTELFRGAYRARKAYAGFNDYDVTADGSRFIVIKQVEQPAALPIVVTLNWFQELEATLRRP